MCGLQASGGRCTHTDTCINKRRFQLAAYMWLVDLSPVPAKASFGAWHAAVHKQLHTAPVQHAQRMHAALRRRIPIIADTYVDREFGTGALKITPGHDTNDYEIGRRVGLPMLNIMNDDGTLSATAGAYAGLDRFVARKRIWADIEVCL